MTLIDKLRRRDPSPLPPLVPPSPGRNPLDLRITPPRPAPPEVGLNLLQAPLRRPVGAPVESLGLSPGTSPKPSAHEGSYGLSAGWATYDVSPHSVSFPQGISPGPRPPASPALAEEKAQWRSRSFNLPILEEAKTKRLVQLPENLLPPCPPSARPESQALPSAPPSPPSWALLASLPEQGFDRIAAWAAAVPMGTPPDFKFPEQQPQLLDEAAWAQSSTAARGQEAYGPLRPQAADMLGTQALDQYCNEAGRPQEMTQRFAVARSCYEAAQQGRAELSLIGLGEVEELPLGLGVLGGLRRLELVDLAIMVLPSLAGLWALEELVIRNCRNLRQMPWTLSLLPNLRRVVLDSLPLLVALPRLPQADTILRLCPNLPQGMVDASTGRSTSRNLL